MKAVVGTALLAGAIALTVATGGVGAIAAIGASGEMGALFAGLVVTAAMSGAELDLSSIADALTNTPTTPQTIRSPAAPWKAIYGNVRTGGTVIDCNSYGDNFKYCDQVIALACHPTVGIQLHTEQVGTTATFPSYGGLYINGQGMQWRNDAQGGSGVPGSVGYDINGTPFGHTTSNDLQDLNQNHYSTGQHVYMEAYNGSGKSYQKGALVDNQVSTFYIESGPAGHWNSNCTMMIDVGTSAYTGGTTANPIYANEQGVPKGITYVYLRLLYSSTLWAGGLPSSLRFDVQGKNDIWDPRLNSGAGGYGYTNNAALVIADFLTNPYFGMGYKMAEINQEALIAAANICDTAIPLAAGGTIPEYTINGVFDVSQNPASTLQTMLQSCGGNISYVGGQWHIFPGTYVYPSAVITPSMLVGPMDISLNQKPRNLINAVKGSFICPAAIDTIGSHNIFLNEQPNIFNGQWQPQSYPPYAMDSQHGYDSDLWLAEDGQKLYKDVSFPFTTNAATCQRLAKQILMKNRNGNGLEDSQNKGLTFSVDCNLSAYDIVPHDTVWFDYPRFNWTAPPAGFSTSTQDIPEYTYTEFEVVNTSLSMKSQNGEAPTPVYTLHLRATSPNNWLWNPADELPMTENKYPQFANTEQVAAPTDFVITSGSETVITSNDGTMTSSILCTWTPPNDAYVTNGGQIVVQIMPVVTGSNTYTCTANMSNITINGATNPFVAGEVILLKGADTDGGDLTSQVLDVSGQTCNLTVAPRTAVTGGTILTAGWDTIATLYGGTSSYSIIGVADDAEYYVQIFSMNSAGITSNCTIAGPITVSNGLTFTETGVPVYPVGNPQIPIVQGATGVNSNLLPDSDFKFNLYNINSTATSYWSGPPPPFDQWQRVVGAGYQGMNAVAAPVSGSSLASNPFTVPANTVCTLSGYIDATYLTSGSPSIGIYSPDLSILFGQIMQTPGRAGRLSSTFTIPPGTITAVALVTSTAFTTSPAGKQVLFSAPMLQVGSSATAYVSGIFDNGSGTISHGAMPPGVQAAITPDGAVLNFGDSSGTHMQANGAGSIGLYDSAGNLINNAAIPKRGVATRPFLQTNGAVVNDGERVYFNQADGSPYLLDTNGGTIEAMTSPPIVQLTAVNPPSTLGLFAAADISATSFLVNSKAQSNTTYETITLTNSTVEYHAGVSDTVLDAAHDGYNTNVILGSGGDGLSATQIDFAVELTADTNRSGSAGTYTPATQRTSVSADVVVVAQNSLASPAIGGFPSVAIVSGQTVTLNATVDCNYSNVGEYNVRGVAISFQYSKDGGSTWTTFASKSDTWNNGGADASDSYGPTGAFATITSGLSNLSALQARVLTFVNGGADTEINVFGEITAINAVTTAAGPPAYSGTSTFVAQVCAGNMGTVLAETEIGVNWASDGGSYSGGASLSVLIADGTAFTTRVYAITDLTVPGLLGFADAYQPRATLSGAASVNGLDFTAFILEGW